jgi:hypothetical protein
VAPKVNEAFAAAFRARSALTLEALLNPSGLDQTGPAEIVSLASRPDDHNLCLAQEKGLLHFSVKTSGDAKRWITLCRLAAGRPQHVVVTYTPGRLTCYLDGRQVTTTGSLTGDLSGWTPVPLVMGNNWTSQRPWHGLLEGVRLYARAFAAEEAHDHYRAWRAKLDARKPVGRIEIRGKLLGKSELPEPRSQTYSMARALFEYEVKEVLSGTCESASVLVSHYAWADFKLLEPAGFRVGSLHRLVLEPCSLHPELEDIRAHETLDVDLERPVHFDVGPIRYLKPGKAIRCRDEQPAS